MTLEEILDKIRQEHGLAALRDGNRLMGMFADYSKSQLRPQANALRIFLDCRGNERILKLKDTLGLTRQTEYYRLVQEMVRDYNMQEAIARDVCDSFWRVAAGMEPPAPGAKSVPESVAEPVLESAPSIPDLKAPEPTWTAEELYQQGHAFYQNRNYSEAVRRYWKAAEQGHMRAQLELGQAYETGQGVERSYIEAVSWFRKAAEQGYAPAQDKMCSCYEKGIGVDRNLEKAVMWCKLACQQDYPGAARHLRQMEAKLSEERPELFPELTDQEFGILNDVLVKYNGSATDVVVPKGVKRIGPQAFENNRTIRSVILPDKLLGISAAAFSGCVNLKEVVIPGSVVTMNLECFPGCKNLKKLVLQSGVQKLIFGQRLADFCSLNLVVPDTVTSVTWSNIVESDRKTRMAHPKKIIASEKWGEAFKNFFADNPDFTHRKRAEQSKYKIPLFRPEHSIQEKCLLCLGWAVSLFILSLFIIGRIRTGLSTDIFISIIGVGFYGLPVVRRQYILWHRMKSWAPKNSILKTIYEVWMVFDCLIAISYSGMPVLSILIKEEFLLLFLPFSVYFIWWYIWNKRLK